MALGLAPRHFSWAVLVDRRCGRIALVRYRIRALRAIGAIRLPVAGSAVIMTARNQALAGWRWLRRAAGRQQAVQLTDSDDENLLRFINVLVMPNRLLSSNGHHIVMKIQRLADGSN